MKNMVLTTLFSLTLLPGVAGAWDRLEGQSSGIREKRMLAVRSRQEWSELWAKHAGVRAAVPDVDFSREMLVAVFLGEEQTGGHKVRVEVVPDPIDVSQVFVLYSKVAPAKSGFQLQMICQPFTIHKVKVYKKVVFEENQKVKALEPEEAQVQGYSTEAPAENNAVAKWLSKLESIVRSAETTDGSHP